MKDGTIPRLSNTTLPLLAGKASLPNYDRSAVKRGIVHLGVGAFHRAHQAVYTEAVLNAGDLRWGIVGASLRSPDTHDALKSQNWLYTLGIRDGSLDRLQINGGMLDLLVAPDDPEALIRAMTEANVRIVSLTVTEKGYCHDPATGQLREDHPDIVHDLGDTAAPRSALGFILQAILRRRSAGLPPFTLLSCDNLPENGTTLKRVLLRFCTLLAARHPMGDLSTLASFIEREVHCPCTMIDRIVPATTDADRDWFRAQSGVVDAWPISTEPFTQWVIEDRFGADRPDWTILGAQFVADARPYETMKLRLLNGAHSAIAYLGYLAGCQTVAEAMAQPIIAAFVGRMMREEIRPVLTMPEDADVDAYIDALLERFRNPALHHRTWQIAMDGSQKIPQRWLGTIRDRLAAGARIACLAHGIAAWMIYVRGRDLGGMPIDVRDPLVEDLKRAADSADPVDRLLAMTAIFGTDLPADDNFRKAIATAYRRLLDIGVRRALETI